LRWERFGNIDRSSLALETNGKGFIGFLSELPGAFVRGKTKQDALSKVEIEAKSYLRWLGTTSPSSTISVMISEEHRSSLRIEDGDSEILLNIDRGKMREEELNALTELSIYSGETFFSLYQKSKLKDWVDKNRIRKTFYGSNPSTIQEIFDHVNSTQNYYLSRIETVDKRYPLTFLDKRKFCLDEIKKMFKEHDNSIVWDKEDESWTLKKLLRRYTWHDRIHAKAIARVLRHQKELGLIEHYEDPFYFDFSYL
jgi:hypothetical protein